MKPAPRSMTRNQNRPQGKRPQAGPNRREKSRMRVMPRRFVIATMLTAMAGLAGLTAAGTASASPAAPQVSFPACSAVHPPFYPIMNVAAEQRMDTNEPVNTGYALDNFTPSMSFCNVYNTAVGGVSYYYYHDTYGDCMTANASTSKAYQAPCGKFPASQAWHYFFSATAKNGTLENYYTGQCLWATGQPPRFGNIVGIGGCTRNQNNVFIES